MASFSTRVLASLDDGYWAGGWLNSGVNQGIGKNGLGQDVYSAFRFQSVAVAQGQTLTSAILSITADENDSSHSIFKVFGIAEDNTANFSSDPISRTKTSASGSKDINTESTNTTYDIDVTSAVQEIINRGGWVSGNALGLITQDNGTANSNILRFFTYDGSTTKCALLTITWAGSSPSASVSPSASNSPSISPSLSPSASKSPSASPSPSPFPPELHGVLKIAKPGINVLTNSDVEKLIFTSEKGTLKYFHKEALTVSFTADITAGVNSGHGVYTHNLGYYPFCEVFVSVNGGAYEYCPFFGSGATLLYSANVKITTTTIEVYGEVSGINSSLWTFDFLIFVFKNNLNL